jgi:3-hydroxyacyl-CoA dehydrogenase
MKLGRSLGRVAVPVRGHVARRLMARQKWEALCLLEEGALPEDVDRALVDFGFSVGPFTAFDLEGAQAALLERKATLGELGPRERACTIFEELALLGRLGKSAAAGFYRYEGDRALPDPAIATLLARHSASRGIARRSISSEQIQDRCLYAVINEAARLLDEKLAARPLDVDMIMVHGCGFPIYRGGPLFYADQIGLGEARARLIQFREQLGEERWTPAPSIERLAAENSSFYQTRG